MDERRHGYVFELKQVIDQSLRIAPADVEPLVVLLAEGDDGRAVLFQHFHALVQHQPNEAEVLFLQAVENEVLDAHVVHAKFEQFGGKAEDLRRGGILERPRVRQDARVEAVANGRRDFLLVAEQADEIVNQFAGGTGRGVVQVVVVKWLWEQVVVNQYFFCLQRGNQFAHFVNPLQGVEVEAKHDVWLFEHPLDVFLVDVVDEDIVGTRHPIQEVGGLGRNGHFDGMAKLVQIVLQAKRGTYGISIWVPVRGDDDVLWHRQQRLYFFDIFHAKTRLKFGRAKFPKFTIITKL